MPVARTTTKLVKRRLPFRHPLGTNAAGGEIQGLDGKSVGEAIKDLLLVLVVGRLGGVPPARVLQQYLENGARIFWPQCQLRCKLTTELSTKRRLELTSEREDVERAGVLRARAGAL